MTFISKSTIIKFFYIIIDLFFTYLAIFLACWIRQEIIPFQIKFHFPLEPNNPFRLVFLFWFSTIVFFNNAHDLYQTKRELIESLEIWSVIKSVCFSSLVVIAGIYIVKIQGFPRSVLISTVFFLIVFFSLWRLFKRLFVQYLVSHGYNNFNVLIVGAGKVGFALANEIKQRPALGIKIIGFLDDFKSPDSCPEENIKILGKISDFEAIVRREFINKVFITIHHDSRVFLQLLETAKDLGIAVRVVPQGFELTSGEFSKYNIGFIPILEYSDVQHFRNQAGKRIFDFLLSLLLFFILLPVFLLVAVLIKLDTPGPIFYLSKRYGRRGQMFAMLKFRSMIQNADQGIEHLRMKNEVDGPIFKIKKDPRITKFGALLRKFSLDELPQIINVIKGDMSLVGPRPLPIDQIEKEDLRQLKRLEVRPGITGLWQIRGRSDISFSRLVKWDIWYINNWSFWLDFNILLQTIPVVLKGKGAY